MQYFKIALIGSGKLASNLAIALEENGHIITDIYSRNIANAETLCAQLYDAKATNSLDFSKSEANIFIIAIADDAIEESAKLLQTPPNAFVFHTSGSVHIKSLMWIGENYGVFYPLQTFTKNRKVPFEHIPICIESNNEAVKEIAITIGSSISTKVFELNSEQRAKAHLAAVFACNFVNHLYVLSENILQSDAMNFELFHALIAETASKAIEIGPSKAQTGPALRRDLKTLTRHQKLLQPNDELLNIYKILSESIIENN